MVKLTKNKKYFEHILNNLRKEDLQEVKTVWKDDWKEKTMESLSDKKILVLFSDNTPIAMGGAVPIKDKKLKMAVVWLLCSAEISSNKKLFFSSLLKEIDKINNRYDIMFNYIFKSNFGAKRWLKKLGFKFDRPKPLGLNVKEDFEFFYKVKEGAKI